MKTAQLVRNPDDGIQVCGRIIHENFAVDTLEKLSKLITTGDYVCTYNRSPRLSALATANWIKKNPGKQLSECPDEILNYMTYEITNVPDRSGLRIHPDNLSMLLEGCVAPGYGYSDINADGEIDIINSKKANDDLVTYFNKEDFILSIAA